MRRHNSTRPRPSLFVHAGFLLPGCLGGPEVADEEIPEETSEIAETEEELTAEASPPPVESQATGKRQH